MKLSIRWTIIISCIVLVWGTHIIIMPSSYLMTKRVLTRHMQDIMINISDLTVEQAHNHLEKAKSAAALAKQLLGSNVVSSDIHGSSGLERYLFNQLLIYPHLSGIYVGGLNGDFFMVSRHRKYEPDGFRTKVIRNDEFGRSVDLTWRDASYYQIASEQDPADSFDPRTRPWFKKVREHNHVIWTDPYVFFTAQKPGVTIAGPSYDENGNLKGIVGVDIEIAELSTFISKLRVGKSGKAFILHRNGDIIAYDDLHKLIISGDDGRSDMRLPKIAELNNPIVQKSFDSIHWQQDEDSHLVLNEPEFASFTYAGKNFLSMYTPFPEPELPWIIGVYIPEDDYLAAIKSNQLFNLSVTLVITVLASVLGLIFARKIIAPVVKLAEGAKEIERHDMDTPFELHTPFKEIQATADSFSRMKAALADYANKLHESEKIYRAITNAAKDAIIMMDSGLQVTYFNPAAEKMFGYDSSEVMGRGIHELIAPSRKEVPDDSDIHAYLYESTQIFRDRTIKVTAVTRKGYSIPVELSLSKLLLNDKLHWVAIIRNITERKKAAEIRKRLVNDLHDGIGGSLSNIKLLAEMSKTHDNPGQTTKNLAAIAELSEDCITEIRNYMNILDDTNLGWQSFIAELHQYCAKLLDTHGIEFSMHSEIHPDAPPPTTLLYMNVFKIIKEAMNNIIKHSSGDTVSVETQVREGFTEWIVRDNGSVENFSTDNGRGLLSMTSRVKELGGVISFKREDGFKILLKVPFSRITVREEAIRNTYSYHSHEIS